jgi:urate oxidase
MLVQSAYGKSRVRLVQVARHGDRHHLSDLTVAIRFEGEYAESYTAGDNTDVLPTDTMKNTVYAGRPARHSGAGSLRPDIGDAFS